MLILHIAVALAGLVVTGLAWLFPSSSKLQISYSLVALTVLTGTYLVFSQPAHLTQVCLMGLGYLAVAGVGIYAARHRLLTADNK